MKIRATSLPGILVLTPDIYRDNRGAFWESFNQRDLAAAGLPTSWVQDNFSVSARNVLRGIHYQIVQPQAKLICATHGAILDVAVDLRRSSPYFRQHVAIELNGESGEMTWIPEGFGHGFLALTENAGLIYKVTDYYNPSGERTIAWDDPDLAIPWPISASEAIVSDRDRRAVAFRDAELFP